MRPVSESTARIVKQSFNRKYIALGRIVNNWEEIVGVRLAHKAQPVKIRYRKRDKKNTKPDATLDIAVSSANATLLHYQKDVILERINQIFGEQWISAIRFVSIPSNQEVPKLQKQKTPLTPAQKKTLSDVVADIADDGIREKLESLGHEIISSD